MTTAAATNIETSSMLPIDMSLASTTSAKRHTIGSLLSSGSTSSTTSSCSSSSSFLSTQPLADIELGEAARCSSDHDESTSSSSGSNSPNGKLILVCDGEKLIGTLNCNYLLKQMNKRKLHLPCPLCNSLVVNMSDHLAKTHMIVDFKQRKVLLNMVRQNHIMNPNTVTQLLANNKYLFGKIRRPGQEACETKTSRQSYPQPDNNPAFTQLEKKLDDLIKMASLRGLSLPAAAAVVAASNTPSSTAAAVTLASLHSLLQPVPPSVPATTTPTLQTTQQQQTVLTPDPSDFSEESESNNSNNNTKTESSPETTTTTTNQTTVKKEDVDEEASSSSSASTSSLIKISMIDDATAAQNMTQNMSYLNRIKQLKNKRKSARPAPYTNRSEKSPCGGGVGGENKENQTMPIKVVLQPKSISNNTTSSILGASQTLNIIPQQPAQQQQQHQLQKSIESEKRISELEMRLNHTIKSFSVFQSGVIKQIEQFFKDFQQTVEELQTVKNSLDQQQQQQQQKNVAAIPYFN